MRESGYCPAGEEFNPRAPWNRGLMKVEKLNRGKDELDFIYSEKRKITIKKILMKLIQKLFK